MFLNPVSFNGNYYGKQKEPNTFGNFMIIFVILIQRTFWVTPKIATGDSCKAFHYKPTRSQCTLSWEQINWTDTKSNVSKRKGELRPT